MTATAQPRARVAAAPARQPETRRPPLRVVRPEERSTRSQRRRTRLAVAAGVAFLGLSLFGVVVAHVVLTQNQFELQRMQRQAATEQARYERLREQVAELESPSRIVAAAQERLGMVPPPSVKYLTPAKALGPTTPTPAKGAGGGQQAMSDWSQVKHRLGTRP